MSSRLTLAEYAECAEFFNARPGLISKFLAYHNSRPLGETPSQLNRKYTEGYDAGFKAGLEQAKPPVSDGKDT